MNGEATTYRMNAPMKWAEFKAMPDDMKILYLKLIRDKFNALDKDIAKMMGVHPVTFSGYMKTLGATGKRQNGYTKTDKEGFRSWCDGISDHAADPAADPDEGTEVQPLSEPQEATIEDIEMLPVQKEKAKVFPQSGTMTLEGQFEDVMNTVSLLLGGAKVSLCISWEVIPEDGMCENG